MKFKFFSGREKFQNWTLVLKKSWFLSVVVMKNQIYHLIFLWCDFHEVEVEVWQSQHTLVEVWQSRRSLIVWCSVFTVGLEGHKLYCSSSWFFGISSAERSWKSPETLIFHLSGNPECSSASVYVPTELWHRQEGHPTCKQSHICNSQQFFFPRYLGAQTDLGWSAHK